MSSPLQFEIRMPVELRRSRSEDLPGLEWNGLFWSHRELILEAYQRQAKGEVAMLQADTGGFPIGQAWLDLVRKASDSIAVLWALRVHPAFRRRGLGRALVRFGEELAREHRFRCVEIGVEYDNPVAQSLYRSLGYESAGEETARTTWLDPHGARQTESLTYALWRHPLASTEPRLHP